MISLKVLQKKEKLLAKSLFAAAILCGVLYYVGLSSLFAVLQNISFLDVLYLLAISGVMIWLSSAKWALFVTASGNSVPVLKLMRYYTIGYFYNSFIPSYIGGDVARSYSLGKTLGDQRVAMVATVLERVSGLFAMSLLAAVALVLGYRVNLAIDLLVIGVVLGTGVFLLTLSTRSGVDLLRSFCPSRFLKEFSKIEEASFYARERKDVWSKALLWSIAFHVATVVNTLVAAQAVGWETAPVPELFIMLPIILLIAAVPITPGGIGIQEGAFLFFLTMLGATEPEAFAIGVVLRIKVLFLAMLGGLLWSREK